MYNNNAYRRITAQQSCKIDYVLRTKSKHLQELYKSLLHAQSCLHAHSVAKCLSKLFVTVLVAKGWFISLKRS